MQNDNQTQNGNNWYEMRENSRFRDYRSPGVPPQGSPGPDPEFFKRTFSTIGFAMLAFIGVSQILAGILSIPAVLNSESSGILNSVMLISMVSMYGAGLPVFMLIIKNIPAGGRSPERYKKISLPTFFKIFLASFGLAYAANYITTALTALIGMLFKSGPSDILSELVGDMDLKSVIIFIVIFAPIAEELVFRKYLFKKLIGFGGKAYIIFSAFLFGLFHMNISQMGYAFLLGLILAALVYYTGKVRYSIILHMVFNFLGSVPAVFFMELDKPAPGDLPVSMDVGAMLLSLWGFMIIALMLIGLIIFFRYYKKDKARRAREREYKFFHAGAYPGIDAEPAPAYPGAAYGYAAPERQFAEDSEFYLNFEPEEGENTLPRLRLMFANKGVAVFIAATVFFSLITLLMQFSGFDLF